MKPARKPSSPPAREPAAGIIQGSTDVAYSLRALSRLTGLQEHGLRQLRLAGLPMTTIGRERWVLGEDFIALVRRLRDRGGACSVCPAEVSPDETASSPANPAPGGRRVAHFVDRGGRADG